MLTVGLAAIRQSYQLAQAGEAPGPQPRTLARSSLRRTPQGSSVPLPEQVVAGEQAHPDQSGQLQQPTQQGHAVQRLHQADRQLQHHQQADGREE